MTALNSGFLATVQRTLRQPLCRIRTKLEALPRPTGGFPRRARTMGTAALALARDPWLTGVQIRITLRYAWVQLRRIAKIGLFWVRPIIERLQRIHARDESIGVGFTPVRQYLTVVLLAGTLVYGCAWVQSEPPPPAPVGDVELRAAPMGPPLLDFPAPEEAPPAAVVPASLVDDLLDSPMLDDPDFQRAVDRWDAYWRGAGRRWMPIYLERMASLSTTVDSALASNDLPPSLRYLPIIESGYSLRATSRVGAVGLWQLMPPTARTLGLEVTPLIDERRHPVRSTEAAMVFITDLKREFGSWFLTLAAYNAGPGRVRQILRFHAPGEPYSDSLFWALRDFFPAETQNYVPKLYSTIRVAADPEAYGFEVPETAPLRFDVVYVPGLTSLATVAQAAGVSYDEVARLNPEYLRGVTPPDPAVPVRLPWGQGPTFAQVDASVTGADSVAKALVQAVAPDRTNGDPRSSHGALGGIDPRIAPSLTTIATPTVVPLAPPGSDPMR
jgi:hypothetical protein